LRQAMFTQSVEGKQKTFQASPKRFVQKSIKKNLSFIRIEVTSLD
jgi:hypothetical protein